MVEDGGFLVVFSLISQGLDCLFGNRPDVQLFNNNWNLAAPSEVGGG